MRPVDPDLLDEVIRHAATQVAVEMNPGMGPQGIETYLQGLVEREWFRSTVKATVDAYRYLGGQDDRAEEQLARQAAGTMSDLEQMGPGVELLGILRQHEEALRAAEVVWVVPPDLLVGLRWAWGLRVVRSPEASRPTLAIQWQGQRVVTRSDESQKGT